MAAFPIQCSRHSTSLHSSSLFLKRLATTALPLALLLLLFSSAGCGLTDPLGVDFGKPDPEDLKVLFIGSSYLAVNDMPGIFQGLAEAAEKDVFVAGRVQSGYYLDFFAQDETTARANSTGPGGGSRGDGLEGGHGVGHP